MLTATTTTHLPSRRPLSKDGPTGKQAIWVPMLNSASKGKDITEKQLIILGGTPERQREFLEQLNPPNLRPRYAANDRRRQPRTGAGTVTVPMSNRYALGYTYYDVLDADQEDVLARLNVYMLASPSASFAPLLKPLFTTKTVKDMLITILLDWEEPLKWARQLRQWIRLLRTVILSLDEQTKIEMEETMTAWKEKRVGPDAPSAQPGGSTINPSPDQKSISVSAPPLGPGEWDEGLGVPLSVVCIQAEKIEVLERDYGWGEDQFDFLMQWLRCVLLKHGASLVYTATFDPNNVRTLLHSSLSIHSLLKREVAKHNIVDRDKILVPPNWDSWGKIRILKDGFDPEAVANAWSVEIQGPPEPKQGLFNTVNTGQESASQNETGSDPESAVHMYETTLRNPTDYRPSFQPRTHDETVVVPSVQEFLQTQYEVLEKLKVEDEKEQRKSRQGGAAAGATGSGGVIESANDASSAKGAGAANLTMAERIGPYQINVNGIDFDAEEATKRLRERENERNRIASSGSTSTSTHATTGASAGAGSGVGTPMRRQGSETGADGGQPHTPSSTGAGKQSNDAAAQFFANLIKKQDKRGAVSAGASPTRAPATASPSIRGALGSGPASSVQAGSAEERRRES
ncbi:hypothetical protein A1O3_01671 [Capronia epimyces CBS 606.96]|uniref:Dynein light intermediate chain 1, cytosolic n=1 Tax=Capronia epimyces CBS 606.96 TaxID=1182542 RepID=W9ZF32_9EURO|nr:uncharacterized protein A1O3_01671 [Capronia epimyces CBS 606.96]EXJ93114.1 hypothetical protein A1O3_01671 [Capronia epimyces CBS 606.96]